MAETNKEETGACARKCGGCKFLAGVIVGLLLAGTGFGLYMAGRSHNCYHKSMCPFMMTRQNGMPMMPSKPAK